MPVPKNATPAWVRTALEREYYADSQPADAAPAIAARIVAEEPAFVAAIVRLYVKDRLAAYKTGAERPGPRTPWTDKDKRMARAVGLREQGLPLREIARRLVVSAATVHADLARWDTVRAQSTPLPFRNAVQNTPVASPGLNTGPEHAATVTPIRRTS